METIEQINDDFNVKKPKKKGLIIGGIIAAVVIIALVLVYFLVFAKPQFIFNSAIDRLFKMESKKCDSIKVETKIVASIEAEDASMKEQLSEVEKYALKLGAQMDFEKKQEIVDLGLEYDKEAVADAKVYYNDGDVYAYFEGLFDKYIKAELDEEQKEAIESIFDTAVSEEQSKNSKKAMKIVRDELKAQIKEYGEFDKEKATIDVGDKEKRVTKTTLTLSQKDLCSMISSMCSNLAKNDKFLDCFEQSPKDSLKELAEQIKAVDADSKNNVKISIYTKGLLNNLVAVDMEIYAAEEEQTVTITVVKEDKNSYAYNVSAKASGMKMDVIKGKVETEKDKESKDEQSGKTTITAEVAEAGKLKLVVDYSVEYNQGIDKIDTSNSVNMTELTEQDMQSIMEKLMERPVIGDLIKNQMNGNGLSIGNEDNITDGSDDNTQSLTTSQNEVGNEYYGYLVKYSTPKEFEYNSNYSSSASRYYELKDDSYSDSRIEVEISLYGYTEDEYKKDRINWDYDYYKDESSYYKNITLGTEKTLNVGDKEFKYQILSYESDSEYYKEKYQNVYVWYKLDDENVFTIEFESTNKEISEDIIKGFLNVDITKL